MNTNCAHLKIKTGYKINKTVVAINGSRLFQNLVLGVGVRETMMIYSKFDRRPWQS